MVRSRCRRSEENTLLTEVPSARQHPASLVLVDPPYPNMSASRLQRGKMEAYRTVDDLYDLWKMVPAVETLIGQDTLVGCWVTNHVRLMLLLVRTLTLTWTHTGEGTSLRPREALRCVEAPTSGAARLGQGHVGRCCRGRRPARCPFAEQSRAQAVRDSTFGSSQAKRGRE